MWITQSAMNNVKMIKCGTPEDKKITKIVKMLSSG